jgi:hypothetical protein
MSCISLINLEDLKVFINNKVRIITPPEEIDTEYVGKQLCFAPGEHGSSGSYLMVGLSPGFHVSYVLEGHTSRNP